MPPPIPAEQHNIEIQQNQDAWKKKPLLHKIYQGFYQEMAGFFRPEIVGSAVELGSGMGNIKSVIPDCITTDLFPNPWLDRQENAYALKFGNHEIAHLILFDVWHHLAHPQTALNEFARVLKPGGRLIIFEPGMGWLGQLVYGWLHHEPLGWNHQFSLDAPPGFSPDTAPYFAAQSSATRIFLRNQPACRLDGWRIVTARQLSSLAYVASGGFSKPQIYPTSWLPAVRQLDKFLSLAPRLFATRLLIVLERQQSPQS